MRAPPRVALVGCGWFACEAHLPALKRLESAGAIEIAALCSLSSGSLDRARRVLGRDVGRYTSLEELLLVPEIDVVDLTVPIPAMEEAIRASLSAGKHVISEKPCAGTLEAAQRLLAYHGSLTAAPVWAVAENWRFKPSVMMLQRLVEDGAIGDLTFADFRHVTWADTNGASWRNAGSFAGAHLLDSGVHFMAMLRQVIGDVRRVSACVSRREPQLAGYDSVGASLQFADGVDGLFRLSFASADAPGRSGLVLVGTKGTVSADFTTATLTVTVGHRTKVIRVRNDAWVQGGVHELLDHCIDVIATGKPLRPSPLEAAADVAVIDAMIRASKAEVSTMPSPLRPSGEAARSVVRTYGRMRDFSPKVSVSCDSVDEVRRAVETAAGTGMTIRPRGGGLSWAHHVATKEVSIAIDGLTRIGTIDAGRGTVRVEAGTRLGHLTRALAMRGLTIPSLPFLNEQTIGGAIATATHGTSLRWGSLSDFVESMTLVLASGEVRTLDASDERVLRAARVSLGMLGIVVAVELKIVPMPMVCFRRLELSLETFLRDRTVLLDRHTHLWGKWTLGTDRLTVDSLEECADLAPGAHPYVVGDNAWWQPRQDRPTSLDRVRSKLGGVKRRVLSRLDRHDDITKGDDGHCWTSMQYAVPLHDLEGSLSALTASGFAREHAGKMMEFKFLAGSPRTILGPNATGDTVLFNMWWQVDRSQADQIFSTFEEVMLARNARPHWGKAHRPPGLAYMRQAYPEWETFAGIRDRLDPGRQFTIFAEEQHRPSFEAALA